MTERYAELSALLPLEQPEHKLIIFAKKRIYNDFFRTFGHISHPYFVTLLQKSRNLKKVLQNMKINDIIITLISVRAL